MADPLLIGKGEQQVFLLPEMANRHGLIAGATGTGKTVTLQILAERFSRIGVPVFMADVKGDLAGISQAGSHNKHVQARLDFIGIQDFDFTGYPVTFWDILGEQGHPVRTTISDMGPALLSRLLNLNDTQEGVMTLAFHAAEEQGLAMLDLDDLKTMLHHVAEHREEYQTTYGNVSPASVGAIQRRLLVLESEEGGRLFGEPALNLDDFMQTAEDGRGVINLLAADKLMAYPRLYSTFLLWLLSELFEQLPEVGDADRPKLVFFFDEAHLLFEEAPKALLDKIEQVVRLIRSKGVGVYFITQSPLDIPEDVLGQLGNRVQHALRAFTPKDQKTVRSAAQTFRANPNLDTKTVLTELKVGEALVSTLDQDGSPSIVERTLIRPPQSQMGPIEQKQRADLMTASVLNGVYEKELNRESAHEILTQRESEKKVQKEAAEAQLKEDRKQRGGSRRQSAGEAFIKSAARAVGSQLGRSIIRTLIKSLTRR